LTENLKKITLVQLADDNVERSRKIAQLNPHVH